MVNPSKLSVRSSNSCDDLLRNPIRHGASEVFVSNKRGQSLRLDLFAKPNPQKEELKDNFANDDLPPNYYD